MLKECRADAHLAAGFATHEQLAESNRNPQPQVAVVGHLHWHVCVSRTWGGMHVLWAVQPHVALTAVVPQMHCCCCRHWQSQVLVLKKCRGEVHRADGLGSQAHVTALNRNPHPHV